MKRSFVLLPVCAVLLSSAAMADTITIPLPPPTPLNGADLGGGDDSGAGAGSAATDYSAPVARKKAADYSDDEIRALGQGIVFPYDLLDAPLHRYVNDKGAVYYLKLKGDNDLDTFARAVALADVSQFPTFTLPVSASDPSKGVTVDRNPELTFWINAYNGLRLKAIGDAYPLRGRDFWKKLDSSKNQTVAGRPYSFAELRDKIAGMDPRALFLLMTGTKEGPIAPVAASRYATLNTQLDRMVRLFLNDPAKVAAPNRIANSVEVSPYLLVVDPFFQTDGMRRKYAGVRRLLSAYTANASARGYFATNDYTINPSQGNDDLNEQIGR